ncbi:HD-GYP domain-containing protein [Seongchinamella unica]|uniref:HD-GYP domain-containing protein n=1 Tax=Seongchinamella unica TaxID=2547392 RepID=A0A4R5LX97_9GAMM|nr:HD-GYP domain-containing protein [Seongchinamella unica]TDG15908.1 HD-GYP domain-containing protein [Seongchinamella unica]
MRLVKVPAISLQPGMFVAELDRPWLETPFALQGFVVRDPAEAIYVSRFVDHVFVDAEYKAQRNFLCLDAAPTHAVPQERLELRADMRQARACFDNAAQTLDRVFDSLRAGRSAEISKVQESISPLIESVFKNREAVGALLRLKESGDYRFEHGVSMAAWAAILGRQIGLHRDELETLAVGCAMCDVGMTQLPAELLGQANRLSEAQQRIIRAHPTMGAEMVTDSRNVNFEILGIIENHHERMDGSGYPRGLQGAAIPLLARIAGLVDTYDAMITPRPWAPARTSHEAAQELLDTKGSKFQDALVEQFIQAIGLFPTGTLVELNTGEVGIVTRQNETRRLKPEVVVVLDGNKHKRDPLEIVDLGNQNDPRGIERWITRELLPGSHGVNSEEYYI